MASAGQFVSQNPDLLVRLGAQALNPRIRPVAQIGAGLWEQSLFPQRAKDWLSAQMAVEGEKAGKTSPFEVPGEAVPGAGTVGTVPVRATEEQRMRAMMPPRGQGAAAAATVGDISGSREEVEEQRRRAREAAMRPLGAPQVVTSVQAPSAPPTQLLGRRQQLTMEDLIRLLMQRQSSTRGGGV